MLRKMWAWAALLLAVVLAHALLPIAPPTVKTSGSPFSASTLEVSTAPSRKASVSEQRHVMDPYGGAELAQVLSVAKLPSLASTRSERATARGPPELAPSPAYPSGSPLSRAPPLS